MYYCLGHVVKLLVVSDETAISRDPSKLALDDPASRLPAKAVLPCRSRATSTVRSREAVFLTTCADRKRRHRRNASLMASA